MLVWIYSSKGLTVYAAQPILITVLTLVDRSAVILTDPIFQGMAVSLLFGVLFSTLLTLAVVPLGRITVEQALSACQRDGECKLLQTLSQIHDTQIGR